MNRKLGHLIKAAILAMPLALPGVALAQDNPDKQNAPVENKGAQPESSGMGTPDTTEKTPPAGSLDTSGAAKGVDRNAGGDINKAPEKMETDTHEKTTKTKKSTGDIDKDNPSPSPSPSPDTTH